MARELSRSASLSAIAAVLFLLFTASYYRVGLVAPAGLEILYAWLVLVFALGLSYEVAELILACVFRPLHVPRLEHLKARPSVAVLYTTCDDLVRSAALQLGNQTYSAAKVFILDDSTRAEYVREAADLPFCVVRRNSRRGFKAGNLNNWLTRYGNEFDYIVVCDSDSVLPPTCVDEMLRYAEHPVNRDVAIFETLIHGWNSASHFAEALAGGTALADRIRLRVDNRLQRVLSVGHNNLIRVSALLETDGFEERFLAEDYASTVALYRTGNWRCVVLPIRTYERLPENLREYARRQARWAYQTLELIGLNTSGCSPNVQLKLVFSLQYYLAPILWVGWVVSAAALWSGHSSRIEWGPQADVPSIFVYWYCLWLLPHALRMLILARDGASAVKIGRNVILHASLFVATLWPIARRLATFGTKQPAAFTVTGRAAAPTLVEILAIGWPGFLIAWLPLAIVATQPALLLVGVVWLAPCCLAPFVIHAFQSGKVDVDALRSTSHSDVPWDDP